jgi:putative restriction endonuclease
MLYALAQLQIARRVALPYEEVKASVVPLLELFGHPKRGAQQVYDPFGRLMKQDRVWSVDAPRWTGGDPTDGALRGATGRLATEYLEAAEDDPTFVRDAVRAVLARYFREGEHEELLGQLGPPTQWAGVGGTTAGDSDELERDPAFRERVLNAYAFKCAATSFQAHLGRQAFGLEAAHIRPHSEGGACDVTNGISLNPILHRLFDMGAWALSDERRILVSDRYSESGWPVLDSLRGRLLAPPKNASDAPAIDNIWYHRVERAGFPT